MPLCGRQCPVRGWREARWRTPEVVREVWLQGVFSARSEPCRDHQLPLHYKPVLHAGTLQGLPKAHFLHWGMLVTLSICSICRYTLQSVSQDLSLYEKRIPKKHKYKWWTVCMCVQSSILIACFMPLSYRDKCMSSYEKVRQEFSFLFFMSFYWSG